MNLSVTDIFRGKTTTSVFVLKTTVFTPSKESLAETDKNVRIVLLYLRPTVGTFGLILNFVTFIILSKIGFRKPSIILLLSLTLADSLYLISSVNVVSLLARFNHDRLKYKYYGWEISGALAMCVYILDRLLDVLYLLGAYVSTGVPVLITFERLIATFFPLKFKLIVTSKRVLIINVALWLFWTPWVLFSLSWTTLRTAVLPNGQMVTYKASAYESFNDFYFISFLNTYIFNILTTIVPISLVSLGCLVIGVKLKLIQHHRNLMVTSKETSSRRTTLTLISVSIIFAVTSIIYFAFAISFSSSEMEFTVSYVFPSETTTQILLKATDKSPSQDSIETDEIKRIVQLYIRPMVGAIGLTLNILTFSILSKISFKKTSVILLLSLTLADSLYLINPVNAVLLLAQYNHDSLHYKYYGWDISGALAYFVYILDRFLEVLFVLGGYVSTGVPVLITFERLTATIFPLKFKLIVTTKRVLIINVALWLFWTPWVLCSVPWTTLRSRVLSNGQLISYKSPAFSSEDDFYIYDALNKYFFNILSSIVPMCLVSSGCLVIGVKLKYIQHQRNIMVTSKETTSRRTTLTLLSVSLIFAVTNIIYFILSSLFLSSTPGYTVIRESGDRQRDDRQRDDRQRGDRQRDDRQRDDRQRDDRQRDDRQRDDRQRDDRQRGDRQRGTGRVVTGKEVTGKEMTVISITMTGKEMTGKEVTGKEVSGKEMTGNEVQAV
nr:putative G-protein coupled receptor [Biomphalaria glabrata]